MKENLENMPAINDVINSAFETVGVMEFNSIIERIKKMPQKKALQFIKSHLQLMHKTNGTTITVFKKAKERVEIYMGVWGTTTTDSFSKTDDGIFCSGMTMVEGFIIKYYGEGKVTKDEAIIINDNLLVTGL